MWTYLLISNDLGRAAAAAPYESTCGVPVVRTSVYTGIPLPPPLLVLVGTSAPVVVVYVFAP